ncbi:MAG TPA: DUF6263 family protein, partial [Gemmataceae bacterium]|nr:DUF6263 family protein [Gemmataceae bacterium]
MLQRRMIAGLSVVLAASSLLWADDPPKPPAPAETAAKVNLVWKLEKDKTFYQTMTTTTKQTMKVLNNDVTQTQTQTFYFSWTPTAQTGDDWTITQKIIGVKMDIDLGGSKISYDSTKADNPKNALGDFFSALKDATFTLTVNAPKDKPITVTKVEGRQAFLDKLTAANQPMKPLLEKILSDDSLKQMATPTFAALPNKEVAKGDHWDAKSTLDMGPIGKYENTFTYTYDGKNADAKDDAEKKWDKISVKTELKYTPPDEKAQSGGLPFRIKSADLKSKDPKGTIFFDSAKGRVDNSTMSLSLDGKLSIEISGMTTE